VKGGLLNFGTPRAVKHVLATEKMRLNFTKLVCGTDRLVSSLPPEEMQKMVHYLQMIFALFGQNVFQARPTPSMQESHESCLNYDILAERKTETEPNESSRGKEVH
jgi:hypothetical protein